MQNINPTKNRNRRANFYMFVSGIPVLLGGCIGFASAALLTQLPIFAGASGIVAIILIIASFFAVIIGGVSLYRALTLAHDNERAYEVGEILAQSLGSDPRYRFVRNVSRRSLGYIDAVLVGPPGALVFRVVDYPGTWRNERAEWKELRNGKLRPSRTNPSREVARDVYALRKFLGKRRLDKVPVYGVIVFTDPSVTLQGQGQVVPITKTNRLYEIISRDYLKEERINKPQIEATVDAIIGS